MSLHGVRNLLEACDVRTDDQAGEDVTRVTFFQAEPSTRLERGLEHALHDAFEPAVDLLKRPGKARGVLCHFETGDGDAAAVARLARSVPDGILDAPGARRLEDVDGFLRAALRWRVSVGLWIARRGC